VAATDPFLSRAVDKVRDFTQSTLDEVKWTASKLVELVDAANVQLYEEILMAGEPKSYPRFAELAVSLVAGQEDYPFPGNFRRFKRMVQKDDNGRIINEILLTDYESDRPGMIIFGKDRGYRITPPPTENSDWTLVYEAGAVRALGYGSCPSAGTTTTLKASAPTGSELGILSTRADYYANCYLRVVSGTGPVGEIVRCTGYSYAAGVGTFTVTPAFSTAPQTSDVWEILPCVDYPMDTAIMLRAGMSVISGNADAQWRNVLMQEYRDLLRTILGEAADVQSRVGPSMGSDGLDLFETESY